MTGYFCYFSSFIKYYYAFILSHPLYLTSWISRQTSSRRDHVNKREVERQRERRAHQRVPSCWDLLRGEVSGGNAYGNDYYLRGNRAGRQRRRVVAASAGLVIKSVRCDYYNYVEATRLNSL